MSESERFVLAPDIELATERANSLFEEVRAKLAAVLPVGALIEHIGATAVPACLTKGDLDVVVRVSAEEFNQCQSLLKKLYAENLGSIRTSSFAAFMDEGANPPLGIQLVIIDSEFDFFTLFRDRLRTDPTLVALYNDLKVQYTGQDMAAYRTAKSRFIEDVLNGWLV